MEMSGYGSGPANGQQIVRNARSIASLGVRRPERDARRHCCSQVSDIPTFRSHSSGSDILASLVLHGALSELGRSKLPRPASSCLQGYWNCTKSAISDWKVGTGRHFMSDGRLPGGSSASADYPTSRRGARVCSCCLATFGDPVRAEPSLSFSVFAASSIALSHVVQRLPNSCSSPWYSALNGAKMSSKTQ